MPKDRKGKIFINYRRGDDSAAAGRLYDRLEQQFGKACLFMDVDTIAAGADFVAILEQAVAECDVFLAVIGKSWLAARDTNGARRLDNANDFVRIEIASALRLGKYVIPVLVNEAQMPSADSLPEPLKPLVRRNALRLTHERFRADVQGLVNGIEAALTDEESERHPAIAPAERDFERFEIGTTEDAAIIESYIKQFEATSPLWAAKARQRLSVVNALFEYQQLRRQKIGRERQSEDETKHNALARQISQTNTAKEIFAPEMVPIPFGTFRMGSDVWLSSLRDYWLNTGYEFQRPCHRVTIPNKLLIGKYPVTFAEWDFSQTDSDWQKITGIPHRKPSDFGWGRERRPVIDVSWNDAKAYTKWLSAKTGQAYRLLSEAEWEYACRAGSDGHYCFGNGEKTLGDYAWYFENSGGKTHPVGEKKPNKFGLHDIHGNVWEWCEDSWHPTYDGKPEELKANGGAWVTTEYGVSIRVLRGGAWCNPPRMLRAANRVMTLTEGGADRAGFRLAMTLFPTS
jgi:formylglycine-generating enzyme required for sulfatase activity